MRYDVGIIAHVTVAVIASSSALVVVSPVEDGVCSVIITLVDIVEVSLLPGFFEIRLQVP